MPTRDYDLGGDSSELVEALGKAADALRDVLEAVEKLEGKIEDAGEEAEKATKKGQKGLIDWKKAADGAVTATGALVAGVFAASAAYADAASKIADSTKELDYFHTRTGLSTDTLGGLRRAAEMTGGTLDDLVPEDLGTRIVEALEGTGEGARVFELLGVKVRDTSGNVRDAEGIFRDYVDAMAGLEDQTIAAGLADDMFSDQGTRLLHVLADGTATLDQYSDSAAEFGFKTGPAASEASRKWTNATAALKLAFEDATAQIVGPTMNAASTFINEFALGFMFIKDVAIGTFTRIDDQLARIGKLLTGQISVVDFFNESLEAMTDPWEEAHDRAYKFFVDTNMGLESVAETAESTGKAITINDEREVKARIKAAADEKREKERLAKEAAREREKIERDHTRMIEKIQEDTYQRQIDNLIAGLDGVKDAIEEQQKLWKETANEVVSFFDTMAGAAGDAIEMTMQTHVENLDIIRSARDEAQASMDDIKEQMAEADSKALLMTLDSQRKATKGLIDELDARERATEKAILKSYRIKQASALAEIAINTAVAIMQAWAQLGPIGAGFATGGIITAAAVQAAAVSNEPPPLHSGGMAADEGMIAGRLMRSGEGLAVINQRGAETEELDRLNRDTGGGGSREVRLVLADAGRAFAEATLIEMDRPGSPLAAAGAPSAIDPYRRPR